ncbi:MAG: RNA-binding protein [Acidobacteriia bacterium]|nr:RNA-binding protein [Terriglobia bacterium]
MKNIFVGNLSFSVTEDYLRSLFEKYGAVDRVNIVTDRDTGHARGFGFVEMSNDAEAMKAINSLNGIDLEGRTLNVNEARAKTDRPRSQGGGGGRKRW